jgi:hypothetical protein
VPRTTDRRRFNSLGQSRAEEALAADGDAVNFLRTMQEPLNKAFSQVLAHVEHLPAAPDVPEALNLPVLARQFVVAMRQSEHALLQLIGTRATEPSLLAGATVVRLMLEGALNLMVLLEDPDVAVKAFARDDYRGLRERVAYLERRFNQPARPEDTMQLAKDASALGLTAAETVNLKLIDRWPKPKELRERNNPPHVRGERRAVMDELYRFWYGPLSSMAHLKMAGLRVAAFTHDLRDSQAHSYGIYRSMTATLGVLCSLCVLSEVEAHYSLPPSFDLRVAWGTVRDMDKVCESVCEKRYVQLLGLPRRPPK